MVGEAQPETMLKLVAMDARDALQRLAERIDHDGGATDATALLGELGTVARLHARRLRLALERP